MSRNVVRTNSFSPATEQSWSASLTAWATSAGLQPQPAVVAAASATSPSTANLGRLRMVPPPTKRYHHRRRGPLQSGGGAGLARPVGSAVGCPAMPNALTDAEILDAERRARAALRTAPPTLSPGEGPNQFVLEAQREVVDFIREVGPPAVL